MGFPGDGWKEVGICGITWEIDDLWEVDERQMRFAEDVGGMGGVRCDEAYSRTICTGIA